MAAIIDGSSYPKYWKLTADDASPNAYVLISKSEVYFTVTDATSGTLTATTAGNIISTAADTIDEFGNALATSAAVCNYLNSNK